MFLSKPVTEIISVIRISDLKEIIKEETYNALVTVNDTKRHIYDLKDELDVFIIVCLSPVNELSTIGVTIGAFCLDEILPTTKKIKPTIISYNSYLIDKFIRLSLRNINIDDYNLEDFPNWWPQP